MASNLLKILGTEITTEPRATTVARLREWLTERTPRQVVTVNPEMLVAAQRSDRSKQLLNGADLRLADGSGILFIARLFNLPLPDRFT